MTNLSEPRKSYVPVDLDTHEAAIPVPPVETVIGFDENGKPRTTLPGMVVDCDGEPDVRWDTTEWYDSSKEGKRDPFAAKRLVPRDKSNPTIHSPSCRCGGTGTLPVPVPKDIEPVDPDDDGLDALHAALVKRDATLVEQYDPAIGATIAEIMRRDVAHRTSSGSGRSRTKKTDAKRIRDFDPHPTVDDGRTETQRGRRPKYGETRKPKQQTTVAPQTIEIAREMGTTVADLTHEMLADREFLAQLEAAKKADQAA